MKKLCIAALIALLASATAVFLSPQTVSAQRCFITPANTGSSPTSTACPTSVQGNDDQCFFASISMNTGTTGTFRPGTCPEELTGGPEDSGEPDYIPNDCNDVNLSEDNCGIIRYLVIFINVLSAVVGLVVVGSIIYGGIQYSMAGSDPQKVSEAKRRIRNAVIALVFFLFMYSLLNYLVPGGVLR